MSTEQSRRARLSEQLTAWGYISGWAVVKRVPEPLAVRFFDFVADVASKKGKGPEQLRRNLSRVVGPENVTRELVRASMRSYMRYWREAFRLPAMAGPELVAQIDRHTTRELREKLDEALARGKGIAVALPHAANWDMAGVWLVNHSGEFTTVAERLKPESLFDAFLEYRRSLGFDVIAHSGTEESPVEYMEQKLRENRIVCLMADRDLSGRGVKVNFFGEQCSMPAGTALLAKRTGAAMFVVKAHFREDGWFLDLSDELDTSAPLEEVVQKQADLMAEYIAEQPEDWHMLQPLWHADLSQRRRIAMGLETPVEAVDAVEDEVGKAGGAEGTRSAR